MKRVFISFDYDHDRRYRYLLNALAANPRFAIEFEDFTPGEIQSIDVGRIKAALTRRIRNSTHILVIVGQYANYQHRNHILIGTKNWQWWEIEKAHEENLRFIAVKIQNSNATPTPLFGKNAQWARSFTIHAITNAINFA